jgi:hypothetical protein
MWRSTRIRKIITAAAVTAGNTGDAEPATGLLAEELAASDAAENREVPENPVTGNTPGDGADSGVDDGAVVPEALAV